LARVLIVGLAVNRASKDLVSVGSANLFVASRDRRGVMGCPLPARWGYV